MLERRVGRVAGIFRKERGSYAPNRLVSGDMQIAQRGAGPHTNAAASITNAVNSDDAYILDCWNFLAEGSDTCDISQDTTDLPEGSPACILLDIETGSRKFGIVQFVEQKNTVPLRSQFVTVSFKAKKTSAINVDLKVGILAWDGTADTVTSDIVSSWGGSGTNPTFVANWTLENVPVAGNLLTNWTSFSTTCLLDTASTNNLAVFIWTDLATGTIGDFIRITDVRLESGIFPSDYVHRGYAEELALAQRYFYTVRAAASQTYPFATGFSDSTTVARCLVNLPVPMRILPTLSFGAAGNMDVFADTAAIPVTSIAGASVGSPVTVQIDATTGASQTAGQGVILQLDNSGAGWADFSAEL